MQTPGTTVLPSQLMMHACAERQQAWRWLCSNMLCAECRVLVFSLEPPSEAVATCSILPEEMNLADVGLFILIMRGLEWVSCFLKFKPRVFRMQLSFSVSRCLEAAAGLQVTLDN